MVNQPKLQGKVFHPRKRINRKTKVHLVFDANARREFLTGFHKRKVQRQKKAQDEMKEQLKAERKRIKDEARNLHKTLVVSHRPIPELEELMAEEKTFDFEEHSVSIREISTAEMANENCWIGENKMQYDEDEEGEESTKLPELRTSKEVKKAVKKAATKQVKKSKVFNKKGKMEQSKNRKKSRGQKIKMKNKGKRSKKRLNNNKES